jgi:hypothetical protein
MKFIISYKGILAPMYVTGFSEPMEVDDGTLERSVKATSSRSDAKIFSEHDVEEALALTLRCHPSAAKVAI